MIVALTMRSLVNRLTRQFVSQIHTKGPLNMARAWGYASSELPPGRWHEDYPVANGQRQSPIDIIPSKTKNKRLPPFDISYKIPEMKTVTNTGSSVKFDIVGEESRLSGGPLAGDYTLEQFHFHWGSESTHGSEHLLDGKSFAAELHLVHWNKKYGSFAKSLEHGDGLCVLGAFLQPGEENANYKNLVSEMKRVPFNGDKQNVNEAFDPRILLPEDIRDYFHYPGSLTTPPLNECVQWVVFKKPVILSEDQLQAFRDLHFGGDGSPCMCNNYRPPQNLCSREVLSISS